MCWEAKSGYKVKSKENGHSILSISILVSFENMAKESEFIFQEAGLRDPVSVMNKVRAESIRDVEKENKKISYLDYWKQVPSELIDKVRFYYRYEIFLFDYPETPFYIDPL